MSLKIFHVLFIVLAILLSVGCAVWAFAMGASQIFGYSSAGMAVLLIVYGIMFLRKSRRIIT